ncbi:MAG TPA: gamma-glutamyltransferase [Gammaproteobacteria bacterium]|nr:gamma-glutamyltransferase [Gammaproteobacteria bacterium]
MRLIFLILMAFILPAAYAAYPAPVSAKNGMVVSEQQIASEVGVDILKQGGNAVDAAVAVGYALAVVNPCCGNIGGGGFMLIHLANGENVFLNFREKAPLAASPMMYLDEKGQLIPDKSTYGYAAVGVPGTVMGLEVALKKYGTMTRQQVMAPAIRLAEKGYVLGPGDVFIFEKGLKGFAKQPNVAAIFLKNGKPYEAGDRLVQKKLANTLRLISKNGSDVFYKGKIAQEIVKESQQNGGYLSLKDFAHYNVEELKPIECGYKDINVFSAPPPSSGGVALCEMLNILEGYSLKKMGLYSAESAHYIIEAMRFAFADRNNKLGDPNFVKNPVEELISDEYAAKVRIRINPDKVTSSSSLVELVPQAQKPEGENTTHFSVVDKWGNAVAVTYTINRFFGAYVIAGDTGFFLNDEMDDFAAKPGEANQFGLVQGEANNIQPGKRPLSSMMPTIVMKDNKPLIVLGSPGGPRIISSVLLTILNMVEYGLDVQAAVDAPRFHQQWLPEWVDIEKPFVFSKDTIEKLKAMGYELKYHEPWSAVEAIYIDPKSGMLFGGSDNRKASGGAVGY